MYSQNIVLEIGMCFLLYADTFGNSKEIHIFYKHCMMAHHVLMLL